MNAYNRAGVALLSCSLLCLCGPAAPVSAEKNVYKRIADDFVRYSTDKKVRNVTVVSFARKARTSREESEYFSEKLLACLAESGKLRLLERAQLDKVLEERRLAAAGVTEEHPDGAGGRINPSDAVILGTIFGTRDHLKIIAKMIDPLTGTVLHTVEAQTERQWEIVPDWAEFEFEVPDLRALANMFGEVGMTPQFADLRDVPASLDPEPCDSRRSRLASMQEASLEAKAKYWAQRMRDPEFDSVGLRRNPGGEIRDPQLRKKFYAMVDRYYRSPAAPPLSPLEMDAVISVMGEERRVSDECGLH